MKFESFQDTFEEEGQRLVATVAEIMFTYVKILFTKEESKVIKENALKNLKDEELNQAYADLLENK